MSHSSPSEGDSFMRCMTSNNGCTAVLLQLKSHDSTVILLSVCRLPLSDLNLILCKYLG